MGFFSRLFEKNDSRNSNNAQTLHTSITRALAGVVYHDLTVGQIARALGDTEAKQHVNNVISSLIQALLQNGTANGDETIESLVSDKVQRFHESDLKLKDLDPCVMSFLVWAADDAKNLGSSCCVPIGCLRRRCATWAAGPRTRCADAPNYSVR